MLQLNQSRRRMAVNEAAVTVLAILALVSLSAKAPPAQPTPAPAG